MIDFVARTRHYIDHLAPIFLALPEDRRGAFYTKRGLIAHARLRGVAVARSYGTRTNLVRLLRRRTGLVVTTGVKDLRIARRSGRPQIYNNHGAGFTYSNQHPSYAGSRRGRRGVVLFLCPSMRTVEVERRAFPKIPGVAIGCPKLDSWHLAIRNGAGKPHQSQPLVAISFHFDGRRIPETRSALQHYLPVLPELARTYNLIGHGHPRAAARLRKVFAEIGVPFEPDFEKILERADLYVCDTSSTIFEFASLRRPVVLLNAPWYRKHVSHFGNARFWEHAYVGMHCDAPADLCGVIKMALEDGADWGAARERAVAEVYAVTDGTAANLATRAILETESRLVGYDARRPFLAKADPV